LASAQTPLSNMRITNEQALSFLEAAPDPTLVVDTRGVIAYANVRIEAVLGYKPAELVGEPVELLIPARYRTTHLSHRNRFFASAKARPMGAGLHLHAVHKDGHEIPVEISLSPVTTPDGTFVSSSIRDISTHIELERQLTDANRAKSRFLAAASHDLRQPVQALVLLNRAAATRAAGDDLLRTIVAKQQQALGSIARLLNSLLDISKLEAGAIEPDIEDCEVREIFDELRSEFDELARDKGLSLVIEQCNEVAQSDRRLLTQILENLLANAIKYTRQGFVQLRCFPGDPLLRLEVADSGLGIAPEEIDRIFEEFHQIEQGPTRPEGLGLGLSIVKHTAALLGCNVEVKSAPGKGSVFAISVPRGAAVTRGQPRRATPTVSVPGVGNVLIVDDDAGVLDATRLLLEVSGLNVRAAACEEEALASLRATSWKPDWLIVDYHLRGARTGIEVARAVREYLGSAIPVVVLSGDTSGRAVATEIEGARFLSKPVIAEQLLELIGLK
jgi:two-component system, chemotaxis family, CheB/CheR fusion protein